MKLRHVLPALLLSLWAGDPAAAANFLWKVTGGPGTVYLFGTVHVGKAELYPLPPVIERSFKQSDELIEEIAPPDPETSKRITQTIVQLGTYSSGDAIAKHISPATEKHLAEFAKANGLGTSYAGMKPWLLSLLVSQIEAKRLGFDKAQGLDQHFLNEAEASHKKVGALETADSQIKLFSALPDKLQDQLLTVSLLDADKEPDAIGELLKTWKSGDAAGLEAIVTKTVREHPFLQPVMDKVLYERNDAMAQKIEQMLKAPKTYFVAIGAAHLVGERGIAAQLRAKNYHVEQM